MEHIQVSQEGHILLIKINRPEKLNALSPDMYHALGKALARLNTIQDCALPSYTPRAGILPPE